MVNKKIEKEKEALTSKKEQHAPDPPKSYHSSSQFKREITQSTLEPENNKTLNIELFKIQRRTRISQIMALVSIVIGGVVLSSVALIIAVTAFIKIKTIEKSKENTNTIALILISLRRTSVIAIIMCILAISANIAMIISLYPVLADYLQSGNISTLFGNQFSSPSTNNSIWG